MDDAKLTPAEREILRDLDAYAWGSLDVREQDVRDRFAELASDERERVAAVLARRVEASRARQRAYEPKHAELLEAVEEPERLIEDPE